MRIPLALVVASLVWGTAPAHANQPDTASMGRPVLAQQQALLAKDRVVFKALWHAEGYQKNLVGPSGLSGESVFDQATRKGWYPRVVPAKLQQDGRNGLYILAVEIYSPREKRVLGTGWLLPVYLDTEKRWVILGGGEKLDEVIALARRWQAKQPLTPP